MEVVNEGCKYVAKSKELLLKWYKDSLSHDENDFIRDAIILLDIALEKLSSST
jgi:hypothetical protein